MATTKEKEIDIELVKNDPICQKWITFCLSEPSFEEHHIYERWLKTKQAFWELNKTFLESNGFKYEAGLCRALDFIKMDKYERQDLEGCLLIVKVGSEKKPATKLDIDMTHQLLKEAVGNVKGVRIIVTQANFEIQKVALPQLRRLQSEILTSFDDDENSNPIISNLEL